LNDYIRRIIQKHSFLPPWWSIFINPHFIARRGLYKELLPIAAQINGGVLLDIGCGVKPYAPLFRVNMYVGMETLVSGHSKEAKINDIFFDGSRFPIKPQSIDVVMATQVLEHVFYPESFLSEIVRILKPGGKLIITVPFVWDEHEQPYDYARYTSFGLIAMLERNGFKIIMARKTAGYIQTLVQMTCSYLLTIFGKRNAFFKIVIHFFFCVPIMVLGIFISLVLPRNNDLYLDNIVLGEKI
jgi:SAM-dependent methyltransferase